MSRPGQVRSACLVSPLPVLDPRERLDVAHRVDDRIVVTDGGTRPLPRLGVAPAAGAAGAVVADPPARMTKRAVRLHSIEQSGDPLADTLTGRQALLIVDTNEQVARLSAQLHDLAGSAASTTRPAWSHSWSELGSSRVAVDP